MRYLIASVLILVTLTAGAATLSKWNGITIGRSTTGQIAQLNGKRFGNTSTGMLARIEGFRTLSGSSTRTAATDTGLSGWTLTSVGDDKGVTGGNPLPYTGSDNGDNGSGITISKEMTLVPGSAWSVTVSTSTDDNSMDGILTINGDISDNPGPFTVNGDGDDHTFTGTIGGVMEGIVSISLGNGSYASSTVTISAVSFVHY